MAAAEISGDPSAGMEYLQRLSSAEPPLFLSPSSELSRHARAASRHLFSSLLPFCPRKSRPCLDRLLADDGFEAEQIWAQIDLLSRPVLAAARNELGRIKNQGPPPPAKKVVPKVAVEEKVEEEEDEEEEEEDDDGVDEEDGEEEEEEEEEELNEVEDQFLKIRELEEYIEDGETREYGGSTGDKKKKDGDDVEDEDGEGGDIDLQYGDLGSDEDGDFAENARYTDYFKPTKVRGASKKYDHKKQNRTSDEKDQLHSESEDLEMDDAQKDDIDVDTQDNGTRSTHEKQLLQIQSEIEQMERENMEPKSWFMQGEVTAAKRPRNSALEVDLDFEHNAKPPPVDTQEMLVSLEDLMKKRIIEGQFDDVQRAPSLPSKPPRELKEMDESKSKKGLAEIYEEEYAQKTGLAPAPLTFSDEHKKEATILFKKSFV
ncbi:U3 small nucleolar ribonucleoprotein MPP10-like [Iris pallida]|uniref:U3 small nucleolar ribonucleoprotein MPP10-like n=1 Tax=Iris pallida TaxID=29817 RepID=A0AAX6EGX3_IRIPA|nr:U3 small nucleolar ribonucleoprotein MPP10-like [Iris pallida]